MCYNKDVSLKTYLLSIVFSIILFIYGDKYDKTISIFSFVFGHMQLAEYFLWKHQKCNKINYYITIIIHILLFLQPLSIILAGLYYNVFNIDIKILKILLLIISLLLLYVIILYVRNKKKICSKEDKTGNLNWDLINKKNILFNGLFGVVYMFILIFSWLYLKDKFRGRLLSFILLFTFLLSKFNFKNWESMWCYISNIIPIIFLVNKLY